MSPPPGGDDSEQSVMHTITVFGISMATQAARRRLVVIVYAMLALLIALGWRYDHLQTSGLYIYFVAMLINWRVFGCQGREPRAKSRNARDECSGPLEMDDDNIQYDLFDGVDPIESRKQERLLHRRDRLHYQTYQLMSLSLAAMWLLAMWGVHPPHFIPIGLLPILLNFVVLPAILLALTLPQAILLWTEPDFESNCIPDESYFPGAVSSAR